MRKSKSFKVFIATAIMVCMTVSAVITAEAAVSPYKMLSSGSFSGIASSNRAEIGGMFKKLADVTYTTDQNRKATEASAYSKYVLNSGKLKRSVKGSNETWEGTIKPAYQFMSGIKEKITFTRPFTVTNKKYSYGKVSKYNIEITSSDKRIICGSAHGSVKKISMAAELHEKTGAYKFSLDITTFGGAKVSITGTQKAVMAKVVEGKKTRISYINVPNKHVKVIEGTSKEIVTKTWAPGHKLKTVTKTKKKTTTHKTKSNYGPVENKVFMLNAYLN